MRSRRVAVAQSTQSDGKMRATAQETRATRALVRLGSVFVLIPCAFWRMAALHPGWVPHRLWQAEFKALERVNPDTGLGVEKPALAGRQELITSAPRIALVPFAFRLGRS